MVSKTDHEGRVTAFTYDGLGRLVREQESGAADAKTYVYTFDGRGNRASMVVSGAVNYTVTYSYDVNNRLLTSTKTQGNVREITRFYYDRNGNEVSQLTHTVHPATGGSVSAGLGGDGWKLSSYNGLNQLVGVEKDGVEAVYTYRADGMRHSKEVNGVRTQHVWDGANIVVDITGSSVVSYIRGIGLIAARSGNVWTYYLFNARGDVVQLANAGGVVVRTYRYDAFGVEQNPDENDTNPWRFTGEYFDVETGTVYLRFRHYNPRLGRFTQPDPYWGVHNMRDCIWSITQAANLYVYTMNNPVTFIDPLGLAVWLIHGTWDTPDTWSQDFRNWVGDLFNQSVFAEDWSANFRFDPRHNTVTARQIGAQIIFDAIMDWRSLSIENQDAPIRLIGHSHGGNVAIDVINMLAARDIHVATLITIATPVRNDFQLNSGVTVGQHINLYNRADPIQNAGGGTSGGVIAGRTFSRAANVRVPTPGGTWLRGLVPFAGAAWAGYHNHDFMHSSISVWKNHIVPILRR